MQGIPPIGTGATAAAAGAPAMPPAGDANAAAGAQAAGQSDAASAASASEKVQISGQMQHSAEASDVLSYQDLMILMLLLLLAKGEEDDKQGASGLLLLAQPGQVNLNVQFDMADATAGGASSAAAPAGPEAGQMIDFTA